MAWPSYVPPRISSIFEERNRLAPRARGAPGCPPGVPSSDGTLGDASHQAQGAQSDHNIGAHGYEHAGDLSQSVPGSPYWDPRCQVFDVFAHFHRIIDDWYSLDAAGRRRKYGWLKYLVWNEGGHEVIWSPERASEGIRRNGTNTGHKEHGHISINDDPASEHDTQPIFGAAAPPAHEEDLEMTEAELKKLMGYTAPDGARVEGLLDDAIQHQFGAYVKGKWTPAVLLRKAREKLGL